MLDTEVFLSRRLVECSGASSKHFRRVLEWTQEVFRLRLCVRNLPLFFLCFSEHFQAFFCFKAHSRSRVLTANGQFIDAACGDTVYFVDPTPYHVVRVAPSTNSLMIHPALNSRRRSLLVGFSALWANLNLWLSWLLTLIPSKIVICVPPFCLRFYQISWTSVLSQLRLWPPMLVTSLTPLSTENLLLFCEKQTNLSFSRNN